ncbi:MAG: hypothetical protein CK424_05525 [Legionella sp.]|nr:MAG: hypothetical protein CK424_05525 [Legionella sp.]
MLARNDALSPIQRRINTIQHLIQQHLSIHPSIDLNHRFLLDVLEDMLRVSQNIIPKLFPKFETHPILYEQYDLIRLEYSDIHSRFYYLGYKEYPEQLTSEIIQHFYKRTSGASAHTIVLYQKKLYRYNTLTQALQDIAVPNNDRDKQQNYAALKNRIQQKSAYQIHGATLEERHMLESFTDLKQYAPTKNHIAVVSTLLTDTSSRLEKIVTDYQQLKKTAIGESMKISMLLAAGFTLQWGTQAFFQYFVGHAIPMMNIVFVMNCALVVLGGLIIMELGFALYYHHQHAAFVQLKTDLDQTINCTKQYSNETRAIQSHSMHHFFTQYGKDLQTLLSPPPIPTNPV